MQTRLHYLELTPPWLADPSEPGLESALLGTWRRRCLSSNVVKVSAVPAGLMEEGPEVIRQVSGPTQGQAAGLLCMGPGGQTSTGDQEDPVPDGLAGDALDQPLTGSRIHRWPPM